jgi:DNA-binding winged helix-turn-helix (wHTH) protein
MRERWSKDIVAVQCGELHLDLVHRRATLGDAPMHLPPRIIDLLAFFLAAPDQLHSREAILADVWEGLVVEEGSLGQAVWLLRKAMGPERRESLQSVPKRGYVFHPWSKIVFTRNDQVETPVPAVRVDHSEQQDVAGLAPRPQPSSRVPPTPRNVQAQARGSSGAQAFAFGRIALAALVLIAVALLGSLAAFRPMDSEPTHRTIALWVKPTPESAHRERELALLLEDWLEYRLAASAENLVLTAADLDEEEAYAPSVTLILSVVPVAADANQLKVRVEVLGEEGAARAISRLEATIAQATFDHDLHSISTEVMRHLGVQPALTAGAAFNVGKARRSYAAALQARTEGRHEESLQQLEAALMDAPDFPAIRLRLARAQAVRGEALPANESYRAARALDPIWTVDSPYTLELERAQASTFADSARVAERYLRLHQRYPERPDILLDAVEALASPVERLRLLQERQWTGLPTTIERRAKLLECWSLLTLGRPVEAEACALSISETVISSGNRSALRHLGDAKSVIAIARYNQATEDPGFREFREAAEAHRRDGRDFQALRIEAQAELLAGHPGKDPMPHLDQLLIQAQRNQLRLIELNLYRSLSRRLFNIDDPPAALEYLKKAERVAAVYGGPREIAWVSLTLAGEYWRRGELSQVERQLDAMDTRAMDLDTRVTVNARRALLLHARGEWEAASRLLQSQRAEIERSDPGLISDESLSLIRIQEMDMMLRRGDFSRLSSQLEDFRARAPEHLVGYAEVLDARVRLMTGDSGGAREWVLNQVSESANLAENELDLAEIGLAVGAFGQVQELALRALDRAEVLEYLTEASLARLMLARLAASRKEWTEVETLKEHIENTLVEHNEYFAWNVEFLSLLQIASEGPSPRVKEVADDLLNRAVEKCDLMQASMVHQVLLRLEVESAYIAVCEEWPENWMFASHWVEMAID